MSVLQSFSTPGRVPHDRPEEWSKEVAGLFDKVEEFAQFYNPAQVDTPAGSTATRVIWPAFPGRLQGPDAFEVADGDRGEQDEYCEWAVEREGDSITRITFTTEVPEFWRNLFEQDEDAVLRLYKDYVSDEVEASDLKVNGRYNPFNEWNNSTVGRPAHLIQGSNNLDAAITLAAQATVIRVDDNGVRVTGKQDLVDCGRLGEAARNSDPSIAIAINNAAADGAEITLADPIGLYIDGLMTGGMATPDDADPGAFWHVERGDAGHVVRACFEVRGDDHDYDVSEVTIDGHPIRSGAQLAVRVRVGIDAVIKPADHAPTPEPCV